jgi:2-polyprenyl-3-methyl-5-hydroxy-6-metoxy-1,4-benzoquinol methylase
VDIIDRPAEITERLSIDDRSFNRDYAWHIQRYKFALPYCVGKRVLDAGCGTGYGSSFLAMNGALEVVGIDLSEQALAEAKHYYQRDNVRFLPGDVEKLTEIGALGAPFDVVINFENLEHLPNPGLFLSGVRQVLRDDGALVVSTPNGALTPLDASGNNLNKFHVKEFTEDELRGLLSPIFPSIEMFGQWMTAERLARMEAEYQLFQTINELYYAPPSRIWRAVRSLLGKKNAPPPSYTAINTHYSNEYTIDSLKTPPYPRPPVVIIAVCRP